MPKKPNTKPNAGLEERLAEVVGRIETELQKIEERRVELKNVIGTLQYVSGGHNDQAQTGRRKMSVSARRKIARAQKARWGKLRAKHGRAANAASPQWTDKDDALIVHAAKTQGPVEAPALAKGLHAKLAGRSEGAIRQRIAKLAHKGLLQQHANNSAGHGAGRRMVVEAA